MERFRIFNADEQSLVGKYATMEGVIKKLLTLDMGLSYYFVDDTVDDIEVSADEILNAHHAGEVFHDLQMF